VTNDARFLPSLKNLFVSLFLPVWGMYPPGFGDGQSGHNVWGRKTLPRGNLRVGKGGFEHCWIFPAPGGGSVPFWVSFRTRPQVKSRRVLVSTMVDWEVVRMHIMYINIHIYVYTFTYIHMYTETHAEKRLIGDRVLTVILVWY
jgi:hypothetical protein